MIKNKLDLKICLREDSKFFKLLYPFNFFIRVKYIIFRNLLFPCNPISDQYYIWSYIYALRHLEYHINNNHYIRRAYWAYKLRRLSYKLGYQIPPNVIDRGLTIFHWGPIIINGNCRIGKNVILQPMIVIGQKGPNEVPVIGDNCNICSGARIMGGVKIGNNVTIAPNTCVVKNVPDNCVVAGNPAKIIKLEGKKVNISL